jgi:alpha-tubulin suppressor-like RCC1 family protein
MRTAASVLVWRPRFFATVEAGTFYTCALDLSGEAYCWGHSVPGGQDGSGNPLTCTVLHFEDVDFEEPCSTVPVRVAAGLRFRALAVGGPGACALTADGEAYCWRSKPMGGDTIPNGVAARPVLVPGRAFASVSVGDEEICGITPAGEVYCWRWWYRGTDSTPEACDDWDACLTTPELVATDVRFRSVSVGTHICGISERHEAYCWGFNRRGEVGVAEMGWVKQPYKITDDYIGQIISIAAAQERTCALSLGRDLFCWGGDWGHTPTKVIAGQGIQLSARTRQTCSLTSEGQVRCLEWTHSFEGQLSVPNQAYTLPGELRFAHISVGSEHVCGIALEGDVYCWGANYYGELGHGLRGRSDQPVKVIEPRRSSRQ